MIGIVLDYFISKKKLELQCVIIKSSIDKFRKKDIKKESLPIQKHGLNKEQDSRFFAKTRI